MHKIIKVVVFKDLNMLKLTKDPVFASNFIPRISGEQIIWGGEIMVAAFGGGQLELQKLQFMIGRGFPSITRIEINRYDIKSFWSQGSQLPFFFKIHQSYLASKLKVYQG